VESLPCVARPKRKRKPTNDKWKKKNREKTNGEEKNALGGVVGRGKKTPRGRSTANANEMRSRKKKEGSKREKGEKKTRARKDASVSEVRSLRKGVPRERGGR